MLSPARRLLKVFHPEGIPWPGTALYNCVSASRIFQRHYELVAKDILRYRPQESILDVGTGPGWLLLKLHQRSPRLHLTGLDVSPSMVAKARENMAKAGIPEIIEVKKGSASHIPFADDSFDMVVSTGSVHHWKDPIAGFNEVYRVLKPRGYALMYDIMSDTPAAVLKDGAREFGKLKMLLLWLHAFEEPFYTTEHFESLARTALFKQGRTRFVGVLCCLVLKKEAHST
jgi:ubiquinone/menaquinone biosynthesis C-methylase UbiE